MRTTGKLRPAGWVLVLAAVCGLVLLVHPILHAMHGPDGDADGCALCAVLHAMTLPVVATLAAVVALAACGSLVTARPQLCPLPAPAVRSSRAPPDLAE